MFGLAKTSDALHDATLPIYFGLGPTVEVHWCVYLWQSLSAYRL